MNVTRVTKVLASLTLLLAINPVMASFRCGSALVNQGDWPIEVEERCGQPDYVAQYPQAVIPGLGVVQTEEHWYYNRGPQSFIRRLVFRNGKLHREDSLGYGFYPDNAGPCTTGALQEGISEFEVMARCGDPLSRQVTWQVVTPHRAGSGLAAESYPVPVEEWLYELSNTQFRRVITLRNGRVIDVESTKKPH